MLNTSLVCLPAVPLVHSFISATVVLAPSSLARSSPRSRLAIALDLDLDVAALGLGLGLPRSFSPTCSSQVPSYISDLDAFKAKGVSDVYVVTVNDMFVVNAWKKQLLKDAGKEGAGSVKFGESGGVGGDRCGWVGVGVGRCGSVWILPSPGPSPS